jgi:hypothetical protein
MTAWQRSNITERAEKGFGPISFKRLLLAGGAAGIVAMLGGRALGFAPSCLSAAVVLALVLIITHPVEGMPLLTFSLRTLRGLATWLIHDQEGVISTAGQPCRSPPDGVLLADDVYDAIWETRGDDLPDVIGNTWAGTPTSRAKGCRQPITLHVGRRWLDAESSA